MLRRRTKRDGHLRQPANNVERSFARQLFHLLDIQTRSPDSAADSTRFPPFSVPATGWAMLLPQAQQMSRRTARYLRITGLISLLLSSMSCWYTVYPGQARIRVLSFCCNVPVYAQGDHSRTHASAGLGEFLLRAGYGFEVLPNSMARRIIVAASPTSEKSNENAGVECSHDKKLAMLPLS